MGGDGWWCEGEKEQMNYRLTKRIHTRFCISWALLACHEHFAPLIRALDWFFTSLRCGWSLFGSFETSDRQASEQSVLSRLHLWLTETRRRKVVFARAERETFVAARFGCQAAARTLAVSGDHAQLRQRHFLGRCERRKPCGCVQSTGIQTRDFKF